MAHVSIATNLWDTDEAIILGELLDDDDAWRFLVRLWAWGIEADCESGRIRLSARRLAQVAGYIGDHERFKDALIEARWLVEQDDGTLYMRGWERNKRFFAERNRLRAIDAKRKDERAAKRAADEAAKNATRGTTGGTTPNTTCPSSSSSSSSSSSCDASAQEQDESATRGTTRGVDAQELERRIAEWEYDLGFGGQAMRAARLAPFSEQEIAYAKAKTDAESKTHGKVKFFLEVIERCRREGMEANAPPKLRPEDLADVEAENFRVITEIVNAADECGAIVERRDVARHIAAGMTPDAIKAMYAPREAVSV